VYGGTVLALSVLGVSTSFPPPPLSPLFPLWVRRKKVSSVKRDERGPWVTTCSSPFLITFLFLLFSLFFSFSLEEKIIMHKGERGKRGV